MEYEPVHIRLSRNLKEALLKKNFTVQELAYKSHINENTIYDYLNAKHPNPELGKIKQLAEAFGTNVGTLLN